MALKNWFTDHPQSVGETYSEHLLTALSFGFRMALAGGACMLHGIFPFLFVKTGSTTVRHLHGEMITNRSRALSAPEWADLGAHI
jgi:Family of unknown function (DUF6356)